MTQPQQSNLKTNTDLIESSGSLTLATPAEVRPAKISPRFNFGRTIAPYLLILPTLSFVALFTFYPTIYAGIQSTFKAGRTAFQEPRFVGVQNYLDLFNNDTVIGQEDNFPRIFVNTLVFVAVTVPVATILAFLLALLLNRQFRLNGLYRAAIFYPVLLPLISAASLWSYFFADQIGLINGFLRWVGLSPVGFTRDPNWALPSIMLVLIWKSVGYYMIFFLSGLQSLPTDIYEAAALDGANGWQRLINFTLPLLNGTTLFVMVIAGANAFQTADPLYILGEGQPNNRSNLILYYIFQRFNEPRDTGYVFAMTLVLLSLILVFTVCNFFFFERRANYE